MDGGCGLQSLYSCKCWLVHSVCVSQHNPATVTGKQWLLYMYILFLPMAAGVTLAIYISHFYRTCSEFSTVVKH